jgi:hypothetical protein
VHEHQGKRGGPKPSPWEVDARGLSPIDPEGRAGKSNIVAMDQDRNELLGQLSKRSVSKEMSREKTTGDEGSCI